MRNLFLKFNFKTLSSKVNFRIGIIAIVMNFYFVYVFSLIDTSTTSILIFGLFSAISLIIPIILMKQFSNYIHHAISKITKQSKELENGSFENRITEITQIDELGNISWSMNNMTDQIEALLKEVSTSIEYSSKEKFFRTAMATGLNSSLTNIAAKVNKSLETQKNILRHNKDQKIYLERCTDNILSNMDRFSKGDLTVCLKPERTDDSIGKLTKAFNNSVENIRHLMLTVIEAIESTASASSQISASIQQISVGMQQQNEQTGDVVISVDEMESRIAEASESSDNVRNAAAKSKNQAEDGVVQVTNSKKGMNNILASTEKNMTVLTTLSNKSNQIKDITQVINDIADQTNLLALNAAIEAARAGEHGRGFSVVADEVKKLAEKTSNATNEITQTISGILMETEEANSSMNESFEKVNIGIELNNNVENSLSNILSYTQNVYDGIENVANADKEHLKSVIEVKQNVETINMITEESTKGIEQMAIAMEDLNRLTDNLQNLVTNFKIEAKLEDEVYSNQDSIISILQTT